MSATSATLAGRRAAERNMVDACTITRRTGSVTDPETGVIAVTYATIYTGKCRVKQVVPASRPTDVGQAFLWLQRLEIQLPMSVASVLSDDIVTVTASLLDPDLVGRIFHVRDLGHATHKTSRRHQIEEFTS